MVIGVIAVLISILLPALNAARQQAVRVQCLSQLRQLMMATHLYANDWKGKFPNRRTSGIGYPHEMDRTGFNGVFNFYPDFLNVYVGKNPHAILSCPGQPPLSPTVTPRFASYQYHVFPGPGGWNAAITPWPDLRSRNRISGNPPIWSCLTQTKNGIGTTAAHGRQGASKPPKGLNAAFFDGSASWVRWSDAEMFWSAGIDRNYWPKYRKP